MFYRGERVSIVLLMTQDHSHNTYNGLLVYLQNMTLFAIPLMSLCQVVTLLEWQDFRALMTYIDKQITCEETYMHKTVICVNRLKILAEPKLLEENLPVGETLLNQLLEHIIPCLGKHNQNEKLKQKYGKFI